MSSHNMTLLTVLKDVTNAKSWLRSERFFPGKQQNERWKEDVNSAEVIKQTELTCHTKEMRQNSFSDNNKESEMTIFLRSWNRINLSCSKIFNGFFRKSNRPATCRNDNAARNNNSVDVESSHCVTNARRPSRQSNSFCTGVVEMKRGTNSENENSRNLKPILKKYGTHKSFDHAEVLKANNIPANSKHISFRRRSDGDILPNRRRHSSVRNLGGNLEYARQETLFTVAQRKSVIINKRRKVSSRKHNLGKYV